MKILDVLYYYYYLIYTKVIPDDEPNATAIFCLGASFGFELLCVMYFFLLFFCLEIGKYAYYFVAGFPIITLYFLYWRTGKMLIFTY